MLRNFYLTIVAFTIILSGILALLALPTHDDLYFIHDIQKRGEFDSVINQYLNYSGRFIAYLINNFILSFNNSWFYGIIILFIHVFFSYSLYSITNLLRNIEQKHRYLLTLVIYLFYLTASQFATETAYWQTQTITYLLPFALFLYCFAILLTNAFNKINLLLFAVFIAVASGCSEWITSISILILLYILYRKNAKINLIHKVFFYLIIGLALTLFFIVLSAPGNLIRQSVLHNHIQISLLKAFLVTLLSLGKYFLSIRGVFFILFAFYLSLFLSQKTQLNLKYFLTFGIILFLLGLIPLVFLFKDIPPARTLIFSEIGMLLILISLFYMINKFLHNFYKLFGQILLSLSVLYLGYCSHQAYIYHTSYLDQKITATQSKQPLIELELLPNCDLYHEANASIDTNDYKNLHLKLGWGIRNNIILKDKSQND